MYEIFEGLIKLKGLRVADVVRATGIAPSTFSDWKTGRYTPKQDKLKLIANFLEVSPEYLMTGETHPEFKMPIKPFYLELIRHYELADPVTQSNIRLLLKMPEEEQREKREA